MQRRTVLSLLVASALAPAAFAEAYRSLDWAELMPPGETESLLRSRMFMLTRGPQHGLLGDTVEDLGSIQPGTFRTVAALDGAKVRLKGFFVPLDVGAGKTSSFLLVPYFGACIHAPPPPPNQTVHVVADKPQAVRSLSRAIEVSGVLAARNNSSAMGDTAYRLTLHKLTWLG